MTDPRIAGRTGLLISTYNPFVWYKPHRWLSAAIRKFTGSKWGHSAALIELWGEWYVIEYDPNPKITAWEAWRNTDKIIQIAELKYLYNEKMWANIALSKQDATKYDYASLFIYQPIYQITGQWVGRKNKEGDSRFYCSEYIAWIWNKQLVNLFPKWYQISPADLVRSGVFQPIYEGKAKELSIV